MIQLKSEELEASIDPFGAQLTSIRGTKDNIEYL